MPGIQSECSQDGRAQVLLWLARANEKGGGGWMNIVMYEDPFRRQLYVPFLVLRANKEK